MLPTWRPLKFVAGPLTVPIAAAAATSSHYNATLDFLFLRGGANPSRFTMRSIEFGSRSSTRTLSWKECVNRRHGQFHGANCTTTRLLSSLCLEGLRDMLDAEQLDVQLDGIFAARIASRSVRLHPSRPPFLPL